MASKCSSMESSRRVITRVQSAYTQSRLAMAALGQSAPNSSLWTFPTSLSTFKTFDVHQPAAVSFESNCNTICISAVSETTVSNIYFKSWWRWPSRKLSMNYSTSTIPGLDSRRERSEAKSSVIVFIYAPTFVLLDFPCPILVLLELSFMDMRRSLSGYTWPPGLCFWFSRNLSWFSFRRQKRMWKRNYGAFNSPSPLKKYEELLMSMYYSHDMTYRYSCRVSCTSCISLVWVVATSTRKAELRVEKPLPFFGT